MKACYLAIGVASAIAFGASPAFADHNSPNEEGWANMPNDIHNTRIDTKESGDNEAFRDFVQYGVGADSVNRFASDETTPPGVQAQKGNADAAKTQAKTKQTNGTQTQLMDGTRTQTKQMGGTETKTQQMGGDKVQTRKQLKDGSQTNSRIKEQRRMRPDTATGSGARNRNSRQGSGRRGGGKG